MKQLGIFNKMIWGKAKTLHKAKNAWNLSLSNEEPWPKRGMYISVAQKRVYDSVKRYGFK